MPVTVEMGMGEARGNRNARLAVGLGVGRQEIALFPLYVAATLAGVGIVELLGQGGGDANTPLSPLNTRVTLGATSSPSATTVEDLPSAPLISGTLWDRSS